jgi:hypothetical protein
VEIVAGGGKMKSLSSQTDQYSWYYDSGATNSSGFCKTYRDIRKVEWTLFGENKLIKMDAFGVELDRICIRSSFIENIQASSNSLNIQVFSHIKSNGLSIRCVKIKGS